MEEKELDGLRQEYSEVNNNIRHYSTLRFAIFTVYFAVIGGVISVAFGFVKAEMPGPFDFRLLAKFGGLLFTLVFFIYEYRLEVLLEHKLDIGKKLESKLYYSQIGTRPSAGWFDARFVTRALYCFMIVFWVVALLRKT